MLQINPRLEGRTAVITGGSGGLGAAMARELARQGVKVAILGRNVEKSQALVDEIEGAGGRALAVPCDVLKVEEVLAAEERISEVFGPYQILINGAGGNHPQAITTEEILRKGDILDPEVLSYFDIPVEAFKYTLELNLVGSWIPTQVFTRHMLRAKGAIVINISSMSSPRPMTKVAGYSAGKAAIDNLTKWLAVHLAPVGIRVNAIAPGFFLTSLNQRLLQNEDGSPTARARKILSHTPMGRFGQPEELLGTLLWLLDEEASGFVTGITVPVDGGFLAYSGV
ncbi:MAG: SDR family oxidoreductase [Limnochordia bacterium]|jgi:NAD(P)-dependent dehydrogenase (short-subunit alcohol dehydrogenase family)